LTIPDKRYSADCHRPVTTFEHLLKDYQQGADYSRIQHYEEWLRLVVKIKDEAEIKKTIAGMLDSKEDIYYNVWTNIHYHVWTRKAFQKLLVGLTSLFPYEIVLRERNLTEVISILRKKAI